ncbi:MAG TPA: S9 family peptidase [Nocardioidaceae bacterium]|nr:S9 family peptidase [Nocardioidaceae bacterium]
MLPTDLDHLITVGSPALSPDGATVAFVVTRVDADANAYRSQVWVASVDGASAPRPFTSGEHKDANPAWSPDGARLAFTSSRGTGERTKASIQVAPVGTGGEVVTLAELHEGVDTLRWSPDGSTIAFTTRTPHERYSEDDEGKRQPRRITKLFSRLDNVGPTSDRPQHVYVVPSDGSAPPRNLTPGESAFRGPSWTPDSRSLVVSGAAHDTWDLDRRSDLFLLDAESGERRAITGTTGSYGSPSVSPDGRRTAFLGTDDADSYPRNGHVAVMPTDAGRHTWVSHGLDRTFTPYPDGRSPVWLDEDRLLVSVEDRGDVHLYELLADGSSAPRALWDGTGCVTGFDAGAGAVVFTLSTDTRPGELYVLEDEKPRRLTDLTARFARQAQLQEVERFTVPSTDGTVELDAWFLRPTDFEEGRQYPLLVNVHGGPFTQYANRFFDEVQMQARAGYAVLWCNPRGSSGREEGFGRAISGPSLGGKGWGTVDFDDVMAVLDHALARAPYVDPDRVGIMGGSYGGYMTSWAVSHSDRFKAACSERAANNLLSLEWASDAAGAFRTWFGVSHLDDPEAYLRHSPVSYVKEIDTPLLILHSEGDLRCPVEQADQLFVALRLLEKDVEMVRFTGESHELSRSGSPAHRRQRMEIILEYFDRYLKEQAG